MKSIFKKNQIIIAALAIMIIIAGYINFSGRNDEDKIAEVGTGQTEDYDTYTEETSGDNILDGSTVTLDEDGEAIDVGLLDDVGLDPSTDKEDASEEEVAEGTEDTEGTSETASDETVVETQTADGEEVVATDISDEDSTSEEVATYDITDTGEILVDDEETSAPGEAILVSTVTSPNFFANAKLKREQLRSKNQATLMEIVDNNNVTEAQKEDAINGVINLTAISEKENDTETLLEAKGFSDAVVSIDDGNVEVIINAASITEQEVAQVEDIVKRKTGAKSSEIIIAPVVMEE